MVTTFFPIFLLLYQATLSKKHPRPSFETGGQKLQDWGYVEHPQGIWHPMRYN